MLLIVGLGNPGTKYKNTNHNVGFDVVDKVAASLKIRFSKTDCLSKIAQDRAGTIIAKPQTYMNLSGNAVKQLVHKFGIDPAKELVVCYDDIDLLAGKIRLRESGSAGTHNGVRSIVAELGTQDFLRVRVGTRTDALSNGEVELIDFVLSKRDYALKDVFEKAMTDASIALLDLAKGVPFERVQEKTNKRT